MTQRRLVAAALTVVVLAVIGLLYFQSLSLTRATRSAWMVTRDLGAGAVLGRDNLRQVRITDDSERITEEGIEELRKALSLSHDEVFHFRPRKNNGEYNRLPPDPGKSL